MLRMVLWSPIETVYWRMMRLEVELVLTEWYMVYVAVKQM